MAFSLRRHWVVSVFLLRQWSYNYDLYACAVTMLRPRHVVEDPALRCLYVLSELTTFAGGSHRAYVRFK